MSKRGAQAEPGRNEDSGSRWRGLLAVAMVVMWASVSLRAESNQMDWVEVSPDGRGFVGKSSAEKFTPWGFNYDHDEQGRLLEDYWEAEWARVEQDFREMKELGANVVRIHLQLGKFMESEERTNAVALRRFGRLVALAEREGLHLDVTGLGCYHQQDVPPWYDELPEARRWAVQARFWQAIARIGQASPAIFCYDLMNEPIVPPAEGRRTDWLGPPFAGKHFVQMIALEAKGRARPALAREWVRRLAGAIRQVDTRHLITVGLVSWSLDRPGLSSGFVPNAIAPELDFISVHLYPEKAKVEETLKTLRGFAVGKPVVIEETFPLLCSVGEMERFLQESRAIASGWMGFYWGKTAAECRTSKKMEDALMLAWLELFEKEAVERGMQRRRDGQP